MPPNSRPRRQHQPKAAQQPARQWELQPSPNRLPHRGRPGTTTKGPATRDSGTVSKAVVAMAKTPTGLAEANHGDQVPTTGKRMTQPAGRRTGIDATKAIASQHPTPLLEPRAPEHNPQDRGRKSRTSGGTVAIGGRIRRVCRRRRSSEQPPRLRKFAQPSFGVREDKKNARSLLDRTLLPSRRHSYRRSRRPKAAHCR